MKAFARMHHRKHGRVLSGLLCLLSLSVFHSFSPSLHASRVKDLTIVEGGRDNQLVGYGVVVGLAGDGDSNAATTLRSVSNILQRYGLSVNANDIKAKNAAAVMITADIGAFLK
ncbi:MAG TPA: flagellar basal body P-ring protein FlgI, partial [Opitutus sp.]|nr:flagellar basal body P-ring protein FlgI [Opitutus sp.]